MPDVIFFNWPGGWSRWHLALTFLVVLITYDQGTRFLSYCHLNIADIMCSYLPQTKRFPRRPQVQDTAHGPIHTSTTSQIRVLSGAMG
jgi:hypothetical protein